MPYLLGFVGAGFYRAWVWGSPFPFPMIKAALIRKGQWALTAESLVVEFPFPNALLPKQTGSAPTKLLFNRRIWDVTYVQSAEQTEIRPCSGFDGVLVETGKRSVEAPSFWEMMERCTFVISLKETKRTPPAWEETPKARPHSWIVAEKSRILVPSASVSLSQHSTFNCIFISDGVKLIKLWWVSERRTNFSVHMNIL